MVGEDVQVACHGGVAPPLTTFVTQVEDEDGEREDKESFGESQLLILWELLGNLIKIWFS